jgi:hypothetical protein
MIGLHGLALMVVFPLGPQQTRLWHPGMAGIAALVAAYPFAVVIGGLLARRCPVLPSSARTLAAMSCLAVAPSVLSVDYATFFAARMFGGLVAGVSLVALQRALPPASTTSAGSTPARIIAFGMPASILAATLFDWRAAFLPILAGAVAAFVIAPRQERGPLAVPRESTEGAPFALAATGALAFVSAAYLTVLSGFLVHNAGHTELLISAALLCGALVGLAVPPTISALSRRLSPASVLTTTLGASALSLGSLLVLRGPMSAATSVALLGGFLAINAARHLALATLVRTRLAADQLTAHQTHAHLAHHAGSGLGALCAAGCVHIDPAGSLTGMAPLLACALTATLTGWGAGLLSVRPTRATTALFFNSTPPPHRQKVVS